MYIFPSHHPSKRFVAIFHNGTKIHFGSKNGQTFIDHQDQKLRENYIKRHSKLNENWDDPYNAGSLSRWILWEKPNLRYAVNSFKKRFNLK